MASAPTSCARPAKPSDLAVENSLAVTYTRPLPTDDDLELASRADTDYGTLEGSR